nr:ORF [Escherichia coli]CAA29142.1 unnamed protein product [Escherichia coli]
MFYQGDRILPEALVIHNRFNTPFTLNFSAQRHYFSSGCTLSHFLRLHLSKMLTAAEKKSELFFSLSYRFLLLTFHSFLSLLRMSHLTWLHKVATSWIFHDNVKLHLSEQQE